MITQLLIFLHSTLLTYSGRVHPYTARYVTLSNVNPSGWCEYNFTMIFDTQLPQDGYVEITFPRKDYPAFLGLGTNKKIYAPYPNEVSANIQFANNYRALQIYFGSWPAGKPLTIMIQGIKNPPKSGGTGNFKIATKVGNFIIDQNENFAVIGFAYETKQMISASIEIEGSNYAGELSSYILTIVPGIDLAENIDFKITFPELYDLGYLYPYQCSAHQNKDGWKLSGNLQCLPHKSFQNILYITGNNEKIQKGSKIQIMISNIYNPLRQMQTPLFKFEINSASTNNTLQISEAVEGIYIQAGKMQLVEMFIVDYVPYAGFIRNFVIRFRPKNPFITARITTDFFEVYWCQITKGLLDKSENEDSVCWGKSRMIYLSNFERYKESDFKNEYIEVQFTARIDYKVIMTNPVEIYTYDDEEHLLLVDKDVDSISTQLEILDTPVNQNSNPNAIITTNTNQVSQPVTINVQFGLQNDYSYSNLIQMEIPQLYTGIPICEFQGAGDASYKTYYCSLSSGLLTFDLGDQSSLQGFTCPTNCPKLRITNLYNPPYGNSYGIRVLVFGDGATFPTDVFNKTFVVPIPAFTQAAVTTISNKADQPTAINVQVKVQVDLPAGTKTLPDPFVSYSYIEVFFKQMNVGQTIFLYDLDTGLDDLSDLGCQFEDGLVPTLNKQLGCVLHHGEQAVPTIDDYVKVVIKNYKPLIAGDQTVVTFNIPATYPTQLGIVPQVIVRLVRYDKKIKTIITEQNFQLSSVKNINGQAIPDADLDQLQYIGPNPYSEIYLDTLTIQSDTTMIYYIKTKFNVPAGGTNCLFYNIPTGFSFNMSKVQVSINDVYLPQSNIFHFPIFNLVLLRFINDFPNGVRHKIQFDKVDLPSSLASTFVTHTIKTVLNGQFGDTADFLIDNLENGEFISLSVDVEPKSRNHPYAKYTIHFLTSLTKFEDAYITVDFPPQYNFDTPYDPYLNNIPTSNLKNISEFNTIQESYIGQQAKIYNFDTLQEGSGVTLELFGITNPATAGLYSITVSIRSANDDIIEQQSVNIEIENDIFTKNTFDILDTESVPNNKQFGGILFFRWTSTFLIPKNSEIEISLQRGTYEIHSLGQNNVHCQIKINEAYVGLRGCSSSKVTNNNKIVMIPNAHLYENIELEYYGLVSYFPDQNYADPTDMEMKDISIKIFYKGIEIAETTTVSPIPYADELPQGQEPATLEFYPKNEGEIAYYIFRQPINNLDILSNYKILIKFPAEYDFIIGIDKLKVTSSVLEGALKYYTLPRHIFIYGFYDLLGFSGYLDMKIFGVINPNRYNNDPTGDFGMGVIQQSSILQGTKIISGIIPQLAPGGIELINLSSSTQFCRFTSDYSFKIKPDQKILPSEFGGQLYIDFPDNFIIDSHSGSCDTTRSFSFFSSCELDYFRFFLITNHPTWIGTKDGSIDIDIYSIRSPDLEEETKNFIVYNYDKENMIVLGRSYNNLDISSMYFGYEIDKYFIDVNYNLEYDLEVGSYSDDIKINVTNPVTQELTFSPNLLDSRIYITPNPVQLKLGQSETYFRIAAPRTILLKEFYITWSKTGDTFPTSYLPLRKTKINMVKGTLKRVLEIEPMKYMPQNGTSYPLYMYTKNPPYQEVILKLSFYNDLKQRKLMIEDTKITELGHSTYQDVINDQKVDLEQASIANISDNSLYIKKLMDNVNYTINTSINYNYPQLGVYYGIEGYDGDSYELNITDQQIDILEQELRKPKILEHNILEVNRSTARFQIIGDTKGFIFYIYGDQHMPIPEFENVRFPNLLNKTLAYSNLHYGVDYIRSNEMDVNFTITGLQSNHDYEIAVYIMNLNQVFNVQYSKVYFRTMKMQRIALVTLKLFQSTLALEIKYDFIARMAEMINTPKSRIVEQTTECQQKVIDVSDDPNIYLWNLMIYPDPTNMNELISPLALGEQLNSKRAEIKKFMTRLDEEPFQTIAEIPDDIPSFVISPEMVDRTISSISLQFSSSRCGYGYLIIRERFNSTNSTLVNQTNFAQEFPKIQVCLI